MKRETIAGLIAIIAVAVIFAGCIDEKPPTYTYTLSEAVDKNLVKAEIQSG
jgi:ABC-type uncharacterized transport system auxiliary subunit